jgi:DNA repair protein RadC
VSVQLTNHPRDLAQCAGRLIAKCLGLSNQTECDKLERALRSHGLSVLSRRSSFELTDMTGLSLLQCERLARVFRLGRVVETDRWNSADSVRTAAEVYRLMVPRTRGLERETFQVLLLDGRHRLLSIEKVSEGTLTTSLVHPREVFLPAIRRSAAAILVVHNHPSGDPEPSKQDLEVTRRLLECGRLVGIPLLDHVVIGTGRHVSIRERMEFGSPP